MNRLRIAAYRLESDLRSRLRSETGARRDCGLRAKKLDGHNHLLIYMPSGRSGSGHAVQTPIFSKTEPSDVSPRNSTARVAISAPSATPANPARTTPVAE